MLRQKPVVIGGVYGRLTILGVVTSVKNNGPRVWCKCECGNEKEISFYSIRKGVTKSCGCLMREKQSSGNIKHGYRHTKQYHVWLTMRDRCNNPKSKNYPDYGGRGISVCERWSKYVNFLEDMGEKPDGLSIDRINNDGNYCPENCRWATRREQTQNTRRNLVFTINGETKCLIEWVRGCGINYQTAVNRINRGLPIEEALSLTMGRRKKK